MNVRERKKAARLRSESTSLLHGFLDGGGDVELGKDAAGGPGGAADGDRGGDDLDVLVRSASGGGDALAALGGSRRTSLAVSEPRQEGDGGAAAAAGTSSRVRQLASSGPTALGASLDSSASFGSSWSLSNAAALRERTGSSASRRSSVDGGRERAQLLWQLLRNVIRSRDSPFRKGNRHRLDPLDSRAAEERERAAAGDAAAPPQRSFLAAMQAAMPVQQQIRLILGKESGARTEEDLRVLYGEIQHIKFFDKYDEDVKLELCRVLRRRNCSRHEVVFRQGDAGETFFVIVAGAVGVYIVDPNVRKKEQSQFGAAYEEYKRQQKAEEERAEAARAAAARARAEAEASALAGDKAAGGGSAEEESGPSEEERNAAALAEAAGEDMMQVTTLAVGDSFGELALVRKEPRAATVVCLESTEFMVMSKKDYDRILRVADERRIWERVNFCASVHMLSSATRNTLLSAAYAFKEVSAPRGKVLVHQGRPGEFLMLIVEGSCTVLHRVSESQTFYKCPVTFRSTQTEILEVASLGEREAVGVVDEGETSDYTILSATPIKMLVIHASTLRRVMNTSNRDAMKRLAGEKRAVWDKRVVRLLELRKDGTLPNRSQVAIYYSQVLAGLKFADKAGLLGSTAAELAAKEAAEEQRQAEEAARKAAANQVSQRVSRARSRARSRAQARLRSAASMTAARAGGAPRAGPPAKQPDDAPPSTAGILSVTTRLSGQLVANEQAARNAQRLRGMLAEAADAARKPVAAPTRTVSGGGEKKDDAEDDDDDIGPRARRPRLTSAMRRAASVGVQQDADTGAVLVDDGEGRLIFHADEQAAAEWWDVSGVARPSSRAATALVALPPATDRARPGTAPGVGAQPASPLPTRIENAMRRSVYGETFAAAPALTAAPPATPRPSTSQAPRTAPAAERGGSLAASDTLAWRKNLFLPTGSVSLYVRQREEKENASRPWRRPATLVEEQAAEAEAALRPRFGPRRGRTKAHKVRDFEHRGTGVQNEDVEDVSEATATRYKPMSKDFRVHQTSTVLARRINRHTPRDRGPLSSTAGLTHKGRRHVPADFRDAETNKLDLGAVEQFSMRRGYLVGTRKDTTW